MPRHVAVIMDGNARWARRRVLPPTAGPEAGLRSLWELVRRCSDWGLRFSPSSLSLPTIVIVPRRSPFFYGFVRESDQDGARQLSEKAITYAEETTRRNSRIQLIITVSYSGKHGIVQLCKSIARKVKDGILQVEDINENLIEQELETSCSEYPNPDLLICTDSELWVGNFLLWQLAYAELFFARAFWPDFGEAELIKALVSYQQRQGRYGIRSL